MTETAAPSVAQGHQKGKIDPESARIGARIRDLAEQQGVSLAELSRRLHYSRTYVEQAVKGKIPLKVSVVFRIAEALGLPAEVVLGLGHDDAPAALPLSRWQFDHAWARRSDAGEVVSSERLECPIHDALDPHDALWIIYRSGLTRVVCPRCGQYQVG